MIETQLNIIIGLALMGIGIKIYQLAREKPSRRNYRAVRRYNIKR